LSLRNLRVNSPPREFGPLGRLASPFLDLMALGLAGYSTGRSAVYGLAIWASLSVECNGFFHNQIGSIPRNWLELRDSASMPQLSL
jgi:hypothetical protein